MRYEPSERSLDVIATTLLAREIYTDEERKLLIVEYQNLIMQDKEEAVQLNNLIDSADTEKRKRQHERKMKTDRILSDFEKKHNLIYKIVGFSEEK